MLCAGLASCEMKEEILGDKGFSGDSGYLNMGVVVDEAVNAISTKAGETDDEEIVVEGTPANGFIVELTGPDNYTKTFTYRSGMEPVELPVGDFTVYAHTDGSLDDTTAPFYGKRDNFTIKKDAETKVGIQCEMMNTMFQLKYDPGFIAMYRKWEITVTAGKHSKPYLFEKKDLNDTPQNPDPIYWYLGDEEVKNFIVEVQAWTQDGNIPVTATQSFSKDDQAAYTGGEAVNITMMPGSPDVSTEGTAKIDIEVTLFSPYEDINESIEIDGTPTEPSEPTTPDGPEEPTDKPEGAPTITSDYLESGISYQLADGQVMTGNPEHAVVTVSAPAKFKAIYVKIFGGNSGFNDIIAQMGQEVFQKDPGVDVITIGSDSELSGLSELLAPIPTTEDTEYNLDLANFFVMMNIFGVTVGDADDTTGRDAHEFVITVIDQNNVSESATLKVFINPAE